MKNKKVSVIIPVYNGKEYLKNLFGSIKRQDCDFYEVIIVDDASTDKTIIPYIKENFSEFTVVKNEKNIGFACSCNVGLNYARAQIVCFLNTDVELSESFIRKHIEFLGKNPQIAVAGCKILDKDGKIQSSGVVFEKGFPKYFVDDIKEVRYVEHVDFVGAFVRKSVFEQCGPLSSDYFMKFDDCDFCLRVGRFTNYKLAILPDGLIKHLGRSNSMNCFDNTYYYCRSLIVFQKKFFPEKVLSTVCGHIPGLLLSRLAEGIKNPRLLPASIKIILKGIQGTVSGIKFR